MININEDIKAALGEIAPTYYELFLDKDSVIPCISYSVISNAEEQIANTAGYSRITVRVKAWAPRLTDALSMMERIDDALATIGVFTRRGAGELADGSLVCEIADYSILIRETYSTPRHMEE